MKNNKEKFLRKDKPVVTDIVFINERLPQDSPEDKFIQLAYSVEKNSEHPLAEAIVQKAKQMNIEPLEVQNFKAFPGKGVEALIGNIKILLGTRKLMEENNVEYKFLDKKIESLEEKGRKVMFLARDKELLGIVAVAGF